MRNWNMLSISSGRPLKSCFKRTYEELKPYLDFEFHFSISVLSVPMRNWNLPPAEQLPYPTAVLSVPMRNWNRSFRSSCRAAYRVLSVPMRNWNDLDFLQDLNAVLLVLSVPMRNWNCLMHPKNSMTPSCFKRTYEELKQAFPAVNSRELVSGFKRTYEELKQPLGYATNYFVYRF